jgi:polyisoprenoid-binding protein YceI
VSLPVDRLRSGNPLEDRELKRRLDVRRYPTISGELTELRATGKDGRYLARGDVTFVGQTRAAEDEMFLTVLDETTFRFEGRHTFDIRDFGMEPPKILMLRVHPDVDVRVSIVAQREV